MYNQVSKQIRTPKHDSVKFVTHKLQFFRGITVCSTSKCGVSLSLCNGGLERSRCILNIALVVELLGSGVLPV